MRIVNSTASPNDAETLYYLIHSKDHVVQPGKKHEALERKLQTPDVCRKPVYRGLDRYNAKTVANLRVGDKFKSTTYWSASESRKVAQGFATDYRTNQVIEILAPSKGFCLWKFAVDDMKVMKKTDPKQYEDADGDFMVKSYKEESEWIFGIDVTYTVVEVDANGRVSSIQS